MSSSPFKSEEQECSAYYDTIFLNHLPQIFSEGFSNPDCLYAFFFFFFFPTVKGNSLWVLVCNTKKTSVLILTTCVQVDFFFLKSHWFSTERFMYHWSFWLAVEHHCGHSFSQPQSSTVSAKWLHFCSQDTRVFLKFYRISSCICAFYTFQMIRFSGLNVFFFVKGVLFFFF